MQSIELREDMRVRIFPHARRVWHTNRARNRPRSKGVPEFARSFRLRTVRLVAGRCVQQRVLDTFRPRVLAVNTEHGDDGVIAEGDE